MPRAALTVVPVAIAAMVSTNDQAPWKATADATPTAIRRGRAILVALSRSVKASRVVHR
ncbi:hypothetical protein Aple_089750 [Acrocarpospora pleiomorpha]|uniref:Uncharacterized protein n=1 Tax=Acrocarpospora pleiomorpha TaxID=90975 RepID=A0A5M3XYU5_9ACTN|nr:hypothetical protein Aple_089750 [Acrocarpospora pleiomorpha]